MFGNFRNGRLGFLKALDLRGLSAATIMASIGYTVSESNCDKKRHLGRNFVADAVEVASPSVVNIMSQVKGSFTTQSVLSGGSGFIYSSDGLIVTNAHVVNKAEDGKVLVTMWDGKKKIGRVHSLDNKSDIALVKIMDVERDDLPTARIGSSSDLRPGEFVVALGSPYLLSNSVSFGVVSAVARHSSELGAGSQREFIQTDTSVHTGNSGGPLVNIDGEVIGITTMKLDGVDGISFAIPIDTAQLIIRQLLTSKKVVRPYIGISFAHFIPDRDTEGRLRKRTNIFTAEAYQIVISDVKSDSPAMKAGLCK